MSGSGGGRCLYTHAMYSVLREGEGEELQYNAHVMHEVQVALSSGDLILSCEVNGRQIINSGQACGHFVTEVMGPDQNDVIEWTV